MKCSICGYDEDELLKKKKETIRLIDIEITRILLEQECLLTKWKMENGFTDNIKEQLKQISSNLTEITIKAFLDNVPSFIKLDARLKIVQDYCDKYGITQNTHMKMNAGLLGSISKITKPQNATDTIGDIISLFLKEPFPERIHKETKGLQNELEEYNKAKQDLENIQSFFKEKTYSPDIYGFSHSITASLKRLYEKSHKHIFPTYSVVLCPTCTALFKEAASASFAVEQAKRQAQDNNDWDDDD